MVPLPAKHVKKHENWVARDQFYSHARSNALSSPMSLSDALLVPVLAVSDNEPSDVEMRSIPEAEQPPGALPEEDQAMEDLFGEDHIQKLERSVSIFFSHLFMFSSDTFRALK